MKKYIASKSALKIIFLMASITVILLLASLSCVTNTYDLLDEVNSKEIVRNVDEENINGYISSLSTTSENFWIYIATGSEDILDDYIRVVNEDNNVLDTSNEVLENETSKSQNDIIIENEILNETMRTLELYAIRLKMESLGIDEINMPYEVFNVELSKDDEALSFVEKESRAEEMAYSELYIDTKNTISENTLEYAKLTTQQYGDNYSDLLKQSLSVLGISRIMYFVIFVILFIDGLILYYFVFRPIRSYSNKLNSKNNNFNNCLLPEGTKELQDFAKAYNNVQNEYFQQNQKLLTEISRREMLEQISETIVFSVDLKTGMFKVVDNSETLFLVNHKNYTKDEFVNIIKKKIYQDDIEAFIAYIDNFKKGNEEELFDFRIGRSIDDCIWYSIWYRVLTDENNIPVLINGNMINVDKHKKEAIKQKKLAITDTYTGLLNHKVTLDRTKNYLSQAGKDGRHALLIIDIDDFKKVNDKHGHLAGDIVIKNVATIISNSFRTNDIIGRVGGDEFLVLVKDISNIKFIQQKLACLNKNVNELKIDTINNTSISVSIGVAIYNRNDLTFSELYDRADKNLYYVKNNNKNSYCLELENI